MKKYTAGRTCSSAFSIMEAIFNKIVVRVRALAVVKADMAALACLSGQGTAVADLPNSMIVSKAAGTSQLCINATAILR